MRGVLGKTERMAGSRRFLRVSVGLVALAVIAAFSLVFVSRSLNPSLDDAMCPPRSRVTENILLVIDATDPWSPIRRTALANELVVFSREVPRFARLSVWTVGSPYLDSIRAGGPPVPRLPDLPFAGTPILEVCNPGSAEQVSESLPPWISWLVTNPGLLRDRWEREFESVVGLALEDIGRTDAQDRSPIMETLREAALSVRDSAPFRVVIISDLYQNSERFSVYGDQGFSREDPDVLGDVAELGTSALSEARIHLLLLTPAGGEFIPRNELLSFWEQYFRAQGAVVESVRRIEQ